MIVIHETTSAEHVNEVERELVKQALNQWPHHPEGLASLDAALALGGNHTEPNYSVSPVLIACR